MWTRQSCAELIRGRPVIDDGGAAIQLELPVTNRKQEECNE
jgi:hypothetical protein